MRDIKQYSTLINVTATVAFLLFLVPFSPLKADTAEIICDLDGDTYEIRYKCSVNAPRLILIGVITTRGEGRRVFRYYLKSGSKEGTITIPESRFGPLRRACVAVHKTTGQRETVASDCDYF